MNTIILQLNKTKTKKIIIKKERYIYCKISLSNLKKKYIAKWTKANHKNEKQAKANHKNT